MPGIVTLSPSGDTSGATDAAVINAAFSFTDTDISVQLGPGDWYTNAPLSPGPGNELAGVKGGMNGFSSTHPAGTVIHPVAAFSGGAVIDMADGSRGNRIRDLAILNDLHTRAGLDGITCHRDVNSLWVQRISICLVTGHGIAYYQGSDGTDGDALWMERVMIQRPGLNAVHRPPNDSNITDCHIQYAGQAGDSTNRHGFYSTPNSSGNMCYTACRVDLCVGSAWVIDHKGTYGDATKLTGCSTERNGQSGVLIVNSSSTGTDWRAPVIISGCCFEGDGTGTGPGDANHGQGGEFAGIEVRGQNRVFISGTITAVSTTDDPSGAPKYSLALRQSGSAPGQPETVEWASGRMNYSTGQSGQAILNHSLCDNLMLGETVTQTGGYESTKAVQRFGKVTLKSGSAKVSTPWAFPTSLVQLTPLSNPAGRLYVSSRTTGSFTITSTASTDTCTVAWALSPES